MGKVRKSIIRQIWLPDEWLAEEEPEPPARQSKELRSSRAPPPPAGGPKFRRAARPKRGSSCVFTEGDSRGEPLEEGK
eukprot:g25473.t1